MSIQPASIARTSFLVVALSAVSFLALAQEPPSTPPDSAAAPQAAAGADSGAAADSSASAAEPDSSEYVKSTLPVRPKVTPQHIEVQHILIVFDKSPAARGSKRTQEEARKLAYEVLEQARKGADFDQLVKTWTGDSYPGIYRMANTKVPIKFENEFERGKMVAAFGNVGFELSPGNIGIADYDQKTSPFGWHIIKRLK